MCHFVRYNCSDLIRGVVEGLILPYRVRKCVDWLDHKALLVTLVTMGLSSTVKLRTKVVDRKFNCSDLIRGG